MNSAFTRFVDLKWYENIPDPDSFIYTPEQYGREWAGDYDIFDEPDDILYHQTIPTLANLASGGTILELAAGTGRVAIPLAEKGYVVTACDSSPEMLTVLKEKAAKLKVETKLSVLPALPVDKSADLILLLRNSLWALNSFDDQKAFLMNVSSAIKPNSKLVIEIAVPDIISWTNKQHNTSGALDMQRVTRWSPVSQRLIHRFRIEQADDVSVRDVLLRIIFPSELLLLSDITGFEVEKLWSSWGGTPFADDSQEMILVLKKRHAPKSASK